MSRQWTWRYEHHGRPAPARSENAGIVIRDAAGTRIADVETQWTDTGVPFWPDGTGPTRKVQDHAAEEAIASAIVAPDPTPVIEAARRVAGKEWFSREHYRLSESDQAEIVALADALAAYDAAREGEG